MSNQSSGEKTEQPTAKRLKDLREKGQIAKSKEIVSASVLLGLFAVFWLSFDFFMKHLNNLIRLPVIHMRVPFRQALGNVIHGVATEMIYISTPFVLSAIAFAIISHVLQFGVLFSIEPVKPDMKKINPVEGFKKIFSLSNVIELIKSILKITFLGVLIYLVLRESLDTLVRIPYRGVKGVMAILGMILIRVISLSALAFITVAILDYFFQKYYFLKKNRMTKDEVKRERKEMEGDPLIRKERKRLHMEVASSDVVKNTQKSTVVVSNPTHFAVGVYYKKGETPLPVIMVKGMNNLALQIIKTAQSQDIPVTQDVELARSLYKQGEINQYVPSELLKPMAAVLQWVYRLKATEQ